MLGLLREAAGTLQMREKGKAMFGRRKGSDKYKGAGYRVNRFTPANRNEALQERKRAMASLGRTPKNKRIKKESPLQESGYSSRYDWGRLRLWLVSVVFLVLGCGLWARAYHLQINMGPQYGAMAKRQHTTKEVVQGARGNILDRNGDYLARSVERESIWVNPSQIKDKDAAARQLAKTLGMPVRRVQAILADNKKGFVWLKRKVDDTTANAVRELGIKGVYMDGEYKRVYPYEQLAGQLLGFVDIDSKGLEGLEKSLNSQLAGRSVTYVLERDAAGRRLMTHRTEALRELRGKDIRLTIDTNVQFLAEQALAENIREYGAKWGGCIVVDVPSGDVLAWAQYPFFNPNNVTATPASDRRNRLATDMLEHGSTIKAFLVAAALEEKIVNPSTQIYCEKGRWKFKRFNLHDTHAYGNLPIDKILHVSSNIGAAKVGLMLGAKRYHSYLTRLGFGQSTNLPLASEAKGILRDYSRWADIDLATASFGQSFSATLAQVAQAYMAIAGNGEKRPLRLVMDDSAYYRSGDTLASSVFSTEAHAADASHSEGGDRIFSPETLRQVRSMLREVVEEEGGTGKKARIQGVEVGGKTGTAQKADASGRYGRGRVGSFVGMFPIDNPRFLVCVLLDEPEKNQYGGVIAAPVFRKVAEGTLAYHGLLPDLNEVQAVADKREQSKRAARNQKEKPKSQQKVKTAPSIVRTSVGDAASGQTAKSEPVRREYGPGEMPDVTGLGMRNAVEVFAKHGIMPVFKGRGGIVARQKPEAGSPLPEVKSKKCVLWLEEGA